MPTIPDDPVAGVLYSAPSIQKLSTGIKELQGAGVLFTSLNATGNATTAGPVNISNWATASIALTITRKIQIIYTALINGTAVGNLATIVLTLGGLSLTSTTYISAVGAAGQVDMNAASAIVPLAAGTYSLGATLTRSGAAGTVTMAGTCALQIVDLGPA